MMASRSLFYALLSVLAIFAFSGTIVQNSLTKKQQQQEIVPNDELKEEPTIFLDEQTRIRRSCSAEEAILKVYMYDLPAEFHFGMLSWEDKKSSSRRRKEEDEEEEDAAWPRNLTQIPRYPGGLYQQHSPEYWLTADLLSSTVPSVRRSGCSAVRVLDPEAADVFFVPFFSSLSYNKFCRMQKRGSCVDQNDRLEMKLVRYVTKQAAWRMKGGIDHVLVMHHPNSLRVARSSLRDAMFVVADFGRFSQAVANMRKDLVAPYKHVIPTFAHDSATFDTRKTLLYFQGAIVRKEGGVIRQQLYELLKDDPDVHFTAGNTQRDGIRSATVGMRASKFCLHLAGDTPSSNRLFDAIASHCVPVIISDDIELPFEDKLDYSQFCVFIESEKALRKDYVLKLLRGMRSEEWTRMWKRLKQVEKHFEYQHPTLPDDAVHMTWKAIARRLPLLKLISHKRHKKEDLLTS